MAQTVAIRLYQTATHCGCFRTTKVNQRPEFGKDHSARDASYKALVPPSADLLPTIRFGARWQVCGRSVVVRQAVIADSSTDLTQSLMVGWGEKVFWKIQNTTSTMCSHYLVTTRSVEVVTRSLAGRDDKGSTEISVTTYRPLEESVTTYQ